jgi:hypothetical protein
MAALKVCSIRDLLAASHVADIPLPGKVTVLSSSQSPGEAFEALVTARILSAPVRIAGSLEFCGLFVFVLFFCCGLMEIYVGV